MSFSIIKNILKILGSFINLCMGKKRESLTVLHTVSLFQGHHKLIFGNRGISCVCPINYGR